MDQLWTDLALLLSYSKLAFLIKFITKCAFRCLKSAFYSHFKVINNKILLIKPMCILRPCCYIQYGEVLFKNIPHIKSKHTFANNALNNRIKITVLC